MAPQRRSVTHSFSSPAVSSQATSSADDGDRAAPAVALCPSTHKNKPGLIKIATKAQEPEVFTQTGSESENQRSRFLFPLQSDSRVWIHHVSQAHSEQSQPETDGG